MTYSMTAYGQSAIQTDLGELSCELRGVNHRFLDLALRMPEELRVYESDIRALIATKLSRGRLDVFIRLKENDATELAPNLVLASNLQDVLNQIGSHVPSMQAIRAIDLLRWPGLLESKRVAPDVIKKQVLNVVEQTLDELVNVRAIEGKRMADLIQQRLNAIRSIVKDVTGFLPEIATNYRARMQEKLTEIKDQLDPNRVEQEMIMFLHKTDVAEEIDRLLVHLDEVNAVLSRSEPAGRRLDFLMQELNREANTLGSKSHDPRLTKASVDIKVLIEQMREQVQNIE